MAELPPEVAQTPHSAPLKQHHYQCQRCSACCRWPGEVILTDAEIDPIAAHLGLSPQQFIENYTQLRANRQGLTLTMREDNACIMLEGKHCSINAVKPQQCAGFPNQWRFPNWHQHCEATLREKP